jgi:hypothetical protein
MHEAIIFAGGVALNFRSEAMITSRDYKTPYGIRREYRAGSESLWTEYVKTEKTESSVRGGFWLGIVRGAGYAAAFLLLKRV